MTIAPPAALLGHHGRGLRVIAITPPTLTRSISAASSGPIDMSGTTGWIPALLTTMSRRPKRVDSAAADRRGVALDVSGDGRGARSPSSATSASAASGRLLRVHDDRGARLVQAARDPGADVAARAGHDRDAAGEVEERADVGGVVMSANLAAGGCR